MYIKYKHVLFPEKPFKDTGNCMDHLRLLLKQRAFMMVYLEDVDTENESNYWYVVKKKQVDLEKYKKGSRRNIKRGLEKYSVVLVEKRKIIEEGYDIYVEANKRYGNYNPIGKETYIEDIKRLDEKKYTFWGIFSKESGKMVGYCYNKIIDNVCLYLVEKIIPEHLEQNASYVANYTMDNYYLKKGVDYISAGARNLSHDTNVQEFLVQKMNYERMYCKMNVFSIPGFRLFTRFINRFNIINLDGLIKYFDVASGRN